MSVASTLTTLQSAASVAALTDSAYRLQAALTTQRITLSSREPLKSTEIDAYTLIEEPRRAQRLVTWHARLAVALAGHNGCRAVNVDGAPTLMLVGRWAYANPVRVAFLVLVSAIERLCETERVTNPNFKGKRASYAFKDAATNTVIVALEAGARFTEQAAGTSTQERLRNELLLVNRWLRSNAKLSRMR